MQSKRLVLRNGVFLFCTYLTCNKCTYLAYSMIFCVYFKTTFVLVYERLRTFRNNCKQTTFVVLKYKQKIIENAKYVHLLQVKYVQNRNTPFLKTRCLLCIEGRG